MHYRSATRADAEAIVDFQVAMALETEDLRLDPATCASGVLAVLENPAHGFYYVAEVESRAIGVALTTFEWSDWRNGVVWWIQSVYVHPDFRKRGVYAGLYRHIQQLAESNPLVRGIRLYVDRRNTAAQQVYTRLGMNGEHYQVFEWMKPAG